VIKSFADKRTARLFEGVAVKGVARDLAVSARRKLIDLDAASNLSELAARRGNRLEALQGDRKGQHSIRVNDQWRICFRWLDGNAFDVGLIDYH
jgi:proteic killer suppression protein